jgi:hypothetical protein
MVQWTSAKKTFALGAAVGTGLLVLHCRRRYADHNAAPITLDADLKPAARKVVLAALAKESDPTVLGVLADKLDAAGHDRSAELVGTKAAALTSRVDSEYVGQTYTIGHYQTLAAQRMLRTLGYDVPLDGFYGQKTKLAVEHFQSLHDLDIDGVLNSATMAMLAALTGGGN